MTTTGRGTPAEGPAAPPDGASDAANDAVRPVAILPPYVPPDGDFLQPEMALGAVLPEGAAVAEGTAEASPAGLDTPLDQRTMVSGWTLISRLDGDDFGPPPQPRMLAEGTLINRNYRLVEMVSAGGMGEVYRGENLFTGDPVAVKVILPGLAGDIDMIEMFRREARVLVHLRAEAIVRYHNFVLDEGLERYCLIMEFVEGPHLGDLMRDGRALTDAEALGLMRRLAEGLAQAHARGITHRDLSPDNVILRGGDVADSVLIDFGIARSSEFGDGLAGRFAGKFGFIAPEQLGQAGGVIGPGTDVYGLALLIAAALRGKPLPMGDSMYAAAQARKTIPDLSGISHRLYPLLQHMLEPEPAARPADMDRVIALIDDPMKLPPRYRMPLWPNPAPAPDAPVPRSDRKGPAAERGGGRVAMVAAVLLLLAAASLTLPPVRGWLGGAPAEPALPAELDAPAAWPPRDLASRDGFLADQPMPDCALAERIGSGPDTGVIAVLSASPVDSGPLLSAYEQAFGTRPDITQRRVAPAQCAALDLMRELSGRGTAAPRIDALAQRGADGLAVQARVAPGAIQGALWIALIAPDGAVYDMTAWAQPQPDGSVRVEATVDGAPVDGAAVDGAAVDGAAVAAGDSDPAYLLLALASDQPLAAVAAAPSGADAATLMPAALSELRGQTSAAGTLIAVAPDVPG